MEQPPLLILNRLLFFLNKFARILGILGGACFPPVSYGITSELTGAPGRDRAKRGPEDASGGATCWACVC